MVGGGGEGTEIFDFDNPRMLEKVFREKNYIENYFYLLKSTKSTKTTFQKYWRNIIWADFFGVSIQHKLYQSMEILRNKQQGCKNVL